MFIFNLKVDIKDNQLALTSLKIPLTIIILILLRHTVFEYYPICLSTPFFGGHPVYSGTNTTINIFRYRSATDHVNIFLLGYGIKLKITWKYQFKIVRRKDDSGKNDHVYNTWEMRRDSLCKQMTITSKCQAHS